jgi:hypothetical protein
VVASSGSLRLRTLRMDKSTTDCGNNYFDYGHSRSTGFSSWSSTSGMLTYVNGSTGRGIELTSNASLYAATRFEGRVAGTSLIASSRYQPRESQDNVMDWAIDGAAGVATAGLRCRSTSCACRTLGSTSSRPCGSTWP